MLFCNYPKHRRPACIPLLPTSVSKHWLFKHLTPFTPKQQAVDVHVTREVDVMGPNGREVDVRTETDYLLPLTANEGCSSTMGSPFSPITEMSMGGMSPITPFVIPPTMNTPDAYVFTLPGCGACASIKAALREDGINAEFLDAVTPAEKARFKSLMGFEWQYPTYPQLFVRTERGWYHVGGNRAYQNMRESLKSCLATNSIGECVTR